MMQYSVDHNFVPVWPHVLAGTGPRTISYTHPADHISIASCSYQTPRGHQLAGNGVYGVEGVQGRLEQAELEVGPRLCSGVRAMHLVCCSWIWMPFCVYQRWLRVSRGDSFSTGWMPDFWRWVGSGGLVARRARAGHTNQNL